MRKILRKIDGRKGNVLGDLDAKLLPSLVEIQRGWAKTEKTEGTKKRTRSWDNLVKYCSEISYAFNSHATAF